MPRMKHDSWLDDDGGGVNQVGLDLVMLMLFGFVAIVVLLLPFINPVAKKAQDDIIPPGNIMVEVIWPNEINADVDTWCHAPGDVPVGYSNKGGIVFNLLRDDLGSYMDPAPANMEQCYSRGIMPGEYTVNLHLFSNASGIFPVPVTVIISVKKSSNKELMRVAPPFSVLLYRTGEEITVVRFSLDAEGNGIPGSMHSLFKPLRSAGVVQ